MTLSVVFLVIAVINVFWGVASSIGIAQFLSQRGVNVNMLFLRVFILKYIHDYHRITKEETGQPGPLYYSYVISMNLALLFAFLAIIFK